MTTTCITCNESFDFDQEIYTYSRANPDGTRDTYYPNTCEQCSRDAHEQATIEAQRASAAAEREQQWVAAARPLYRHSDISRFPTVVRDAITEHDITTNIGLGMVGPAGSCKTRAAYMLLRRYLDAKNRIYAVTAPDLAAAAADQFRDQPPRDEFSLSWPPDPKVKARKILDTCRTVDVLLIDDLGKAKMTDRAEMELFSILETRTSDMLPTIWTSNAGSSELAAMFSPDRRDPVMRRLVEFSTIISTGGRPA